MAGPEPDIAKAGPGEVGEALAMLLEASRWLAGRGIDQWPEASLLSPRMAAWMAERAQSGELFFAVLDGARVGTFTLACALTERDRALWGEDGGAAAYLHALTVRRPWAGRGLGAELVRRAAGMAAAAGKVRLRLDCERDNPVLRRYYEESGFVMKGEATAEGVPWKLCLYEKALGGTG